jgi:hypothetical protein
MQFTSVAGHLMELDFTATHKRWRSCNPLELYRAPVVKQVPEVWVWLVVVWGWQLVQAAQHVGSTRLPQRPCDGAPVPLRCRCCSALAGQA